MQIYAKPSEPQGLVCARSHPVKFHGRALVSFYQVAALVDITIQVLELQTYSSDHLVMTSKSQTLAKKARLDHICRQLMYIDRGLLKVELYVDMERAPLA